MGVVTIRAVFYVLMIVISGGLFLYTVLAGMLTWMKAVRSGILQFHKLFHWMFYWCYYGIVIFSLIVSVLNFMEAYNYREAAEVSEIIGVQALLSENIPESEMQNKEFYIEEKRQEYLQKCKHHWQNGVFYLFMAMLWCSMMLLNTGFITAKGYYPLGAQKPKKLIIESKDGELQFYLMSEKKSSDNKPILKLHDTPENRRQFAPLLRKRKSTKGNEYASQKISITSSGSTKTVKIYRRRNRTDRQIESRG